MVKIAHLADIHIRNLKYHKEYGEIFSQLYQRLEEEQVDIIYVGGDIAHTKTQLSPEYFEMCSSFLSSLADIADTYAILGNHDGNLRTANRQDAVTPIVDTLEHPKLKLLKNSGEWEVAEGIIFNNLSIFDSDNWQEPSDPEKINIALYHGSVSGCKTDAGWVMEHGENDISIFEEFDFAMLGDIHRTNQALDKEGKIRYCGSLVQQNHGETDDKGFLVWEIEDRDTFNVRHIKLENPKPFITIELTKKGRMPRKLEIPEGSRLRLVSNNNLPLNRMKRAVDVAKARFKPSAITFLNRALGDRADLDDLTINIGEEDLRDIVVQENLIKEYLQDYEAPGDLLKKIYELNSRYNIIVEESEEISRNVNWKLKSLEWDNLFNYGEGNYIDFEKLVGTVGIFGKNYSGKSSIIDSILYTIFNSTSKNERKNLNVINQNEEYAQGEAKIEIDNKIYTITRQSEKYIKKLKGQETVEAKTDLNFKVYDPVLDIETDLNGVSRNDTDRRIRKIFGTLEDFLITSMTSQLGALQFIQEGSTRRKEILAKFLDLEIFEKKYKMAKDDAADLRGALKRLEGEEFDEKIEEARLNLGENEEATEEQKYACEQMKGALQLFENHLQETEKVIESIPTEIIDVIVVKKKRLDKQIEMRSLKSSNGSFATLLLEDKKNLNKINQFVGEFDIEILKEDRDNAEKLQEKSKSLLFNLDNENCEILRKEKKISLLDEVPCGDSFPDCRFISDAHSAKVSIKSDREKFAVLEVDDRKLREQLRKLNPETIQEQLNKYNIILQKQKNLVNSIQNSELNIEKNEALIVSLSHEINSCEDKIKIYEENKDAIENFEDLLFRKKRTENNISCCQRELEQCKENILNLYKFHGSLEQKLENLRSTKEELEDLRGRFTAYDLFMKCMHSNGISYDIIKKRLPVINNEIAKVLANIVDFEIFFEEEDKRLNILIKHPRYDARPLEMGSGAEKTVAATAIRLALLSVSNLPKPNLFILDEPGTALDEGNMEGFVQILDLVKSYFGTVLLISHLESLKDSVDQQITIERKGEYAYVNHRN